MTKLRPIDTAHELNHWNAFRKGDRQALAELFLSQYDKLYRYGYRLYADDDLVKDCIQELFLKLWNRREFLTKVDEVTPYLCRALRRGIVDALREGPGRFRVWKTDDEYRLEVIFSPEDFLISQQIDEEQRTRLTLALNKLTKRQREAVHLRYFENFEPHQIALIMGLSDQSVYNLLYRSVQVLRDNFFLLMLVCVERP